MNKSVVMKNFLKAHGGDYIKQNGKWYWKKEGQNNQLVTLTFLKNYKPIEQKLEIESKVEVKIEEPIIEVKKQSKRSKSKKITEIVQDVEPTIISEIKDENI